MRALISIDDTDILGGRGTGQLAALIAGGIVERGWGRCDYVSRHQLYVHPEIPYTSHNSAMCFAADIEPSCLAKITRYAAEFLDRECADGSDPGLCIAAPERLDRPELLVAFGRQAKQTVLHKQDAYSLAAELGLHLSEHGGTGQGVIGSLAGVGLRLGGNDGRVRGKLQVIAVDGIASVADIRTQTKVALVQSLDGTALEDEELVEIGEKVKAVLLQGQPVLLVYPSPKQTPGKARWQTCTKEQLRVY